MTEQASYLRIHTLRCSETTNPESILDPVYDAFGFGVCQFGRLTGSTKATLTLVAISSRIQMRDAQRVRENHRCAHPLLNSLKQRETDQHLIVAATRQ